MNLGFIGGCINKQKGIAPEDLYHSVLKRHLQNNLESTEYEICLGSYFSYDQLVNKIKVFESKNKPKVIYLFIRPFPLMPLQKLFVKYENDYGEKYRVLHPSLFNRKLKWDSVLTRNQTSSHFALKRRRIELRDFNLIAGILLGLNYWARKYISQQVLMVREFCFEKQIELRIISTPKNPESIVANLTCKWITKYFNDFCKTHHLEFININGFQLNNFEKDKIHLNSEGHKQLGALIYSNIIKNN